MNEVVRVRRFSLLFGLVRLYSVRVELDEGRALIVGMDGNDVRVGIDSPASATQADFDSEDQDADDFDTPPNLFEAGQAETESYT